MSNLISNMSISIEEVDRIAKLARLKFNETEKKKLQDELSKILDYVGQLKEVESKIADTPIDMEAANLMRDDYDEQSLSPEDVIKQAPAREGNFIKVKSVLE